MSYALADLGKDSKQWAKILPAGWAYHTSYGRWNFARHLAFVQQRLVELMAPDSGVDNIILSMPPRHGKSMFVSQKFPGWVLGNWPHTRVVIVAYEATLATMFSRSVRDDFEEFGRDVFGFSVHPFMRAAHEWTLEGRDEHGARLTGGVRSAGIGGPLTGRGGDLIIIDDPVKNAQQAFSETYRRMVWEWYLSTLFSRREPGAKQIVPMTRWHEDDLAGQLLNRAKELDGQQWVEIALPALCTNPDTDPLGREEGEALWPERWSRKALLEIKGTVSTYWFSALYQQKPAPAEGNIFMRKWWRFWQPPGANLPPVRIEGVDGLRPVIDLPKSEEVISSWDLPFKKTEASSWVCGQKWQRTGSSAFLMDEARARLTFPETVKTFREFHESHPDVTGKFVEDKANGPALMDTCRDDVPGIIPVEPEGDKPSRARGVSYYADAGNVYLPHPQLAPWVWDYIDELSAFPNGAANDRVDCTSQALAQLFGVVDELPGILWGSSAVPK